MKILPDGRVEIKNFDTGEMRQVDPGDLPQYGISLQSYQTLKEISQPQIAPTISAPAVKPAENSAGSSYMPPINPKTVDLGGYTSAISAETDLEKRGKLIDQATKLKGLNANEKPAAQQEREFKTEEVARKAQNLLDVMNEINAGKITGSQAKTAKNFAASKYQEALVNLTGTAATAEELAQYRGQYLNMTMGNILERTGSFFSGKPVTTGEVLDDDSSINQKMVMAINNAKQLRGEKVSLTEGITKPQVVSAPKEKGALDYVTGFPEAVVNNANKYLEAGQSLLSLALRTSTANAALNPDDFRRGQEEQLAMIKNLPQSVQQMFNDFVQALPVQIVDGKPKLDPGKTLSTIAENPIDAALFLTPMLRSLGVDAKITRVAGELPNVAPTMAKQSLRSEMAERLATGVVPTDTSSVIRASETALKDIARTTAVTERGMVKQMEKFIPMGTDNVGKIAANVSATLPPKDIGELQTGLSALFNADAKLSGQAKIVNAVKKEVINNVNKNNLFYDVTGLNNARMYLNRKLQPWYKRGAPIVSNSDLIDYAYSKAANFLKDQMSQQISDPTWKAILDMEHGFIQAIPSMSEKVLSGVVYHGGSPVGYAASFLSGPASFVRLNLARFLGSKADPIYRNILEGRINVNVPGTLQKEAVVNPSASVLPNISGTSTPLEKASGWKPKDQTLYRQPSGEFVPGKKVKLSPPEQKKKISSQANKDILSSVEDALNANDIETAQTLYSQYLAQNRVLPFQTIEESVAKMQEMVAKKTQKEAVGAQKEFYGAYAKTVDKFKAILKRDPEKKYVESGVMLEAQEHIPRSVTGVSSDEVANALGMTEVELMDRLMSEVRRKK